jgi:hypothetical protein
MSRHNTDLAQYTSGLVEYAELPQDRPAIIVNPFTGPRARVAQNTPAEVRHSLLSLQLGVFRLCLLKNRDIGVGVLPERQEILVGGPCLVPIA